jgi:hypothetical protein
MIQRARGSTIEDLKLRREGGKGERGEARVYPHRRVIGLVSAYTPYRRP